MASIPRFYEDVGYRKFAVVNTNIACNKGPMKTNSVVVMCECINRSSNNQKYC